MGGGASIPAENIQTAGEAVIRAAGLSRPETAMREAQLDLLFSTFTPTLNDTGAAKALDEMSKITDKVVSGFENRIDDIAVQNALLRYNGDTSATYDSIATTLTSNQRKIFTKEVSNDVVNRFLAGTADFAGLNADLQVDITSGRISPELASTIQRDVRTEIGAQVNGLVKDITNGKLTVAQAEDYARGISNPVLRSELNATIRKINSRLLRDTGGANAMATVRNILEQPAFSNLGLGMRGVIREVAERRSEESAARDRQADERVTIAEQMRELHGDVDNITDRLRAEHLLRRIGPTVLITFALLLAIGGVALIPGVPITGSAIAAAVTLLGGSSVAGFRSIDTFFGGNSVRRFMRDRMKEVDQDRSRADELEQQARADRTAASRDNLGLVQDLQAANAELSVADLPSDVRVDAERALKALLGTGVMK